MRFDFLPPGAARMESLSALHDPRTPCHLSFFSLARRCQHKRKTTGYRFSSYSAPLQPLLPPPAPHQDQQIPVPR